MRGKCKKKLKVFFFYGQYWSQKIQLGKRNNICFMHYLSKRPLVAKMWRQILNLIFFRDFEAKLNKLESESDIFLCMEVFLNVRLPITTTA